MASAIMLLKSKLTFERSLIIVACVLALTGIIIAIIALAKGDSAGPPGPAGPSGPPGPPGGSLSVPSLVPSPNQQQQQQAFLGAPASAPAPVPRPYDLLNGLRNA